MKKFLSISALLVAITSVGFVSYGAASRYRPTTDRLFAHSYRRTLLRRVSPQPVTEMDKFKFWYNFEQQKKRHYSRHDYAQWRSNHDRLFPRDENLYETGKVVVRGNDARKVSLTRALPKEFKNIWNYGVEGIHFKLPEDIKMNADGQYEDRRSDFVFELEKFDEKCSSLSFQMCAVQRTKHLQARRGLRATSNVKRNFSLRRVEISGRFVYVPQYVETFEVNDFGVDRMYSMTTLQNPVTEEVFYIEGWTSTYNSSRAQNLLKAVSRTITFN